MVRVYKEDYVGFSEFCTESVSFVGEGGSIDDGGGDIVRRSERGR